jgi:biopolymer transport protein ExbD
MASSSKIKQMTEDRPKEARIEIIPLIDVIFFLLATFVLFTLSLNRIQAIEMTLPKAVPVTPQDDDDDKPITLQVSDNGNFYWNQELVAFAEVQYRLANYKEGDPNPRILLTSDDLAKYGDTIKVLDAVREAGINQVSFETVYRPTGR